MKFTSVILALLPLAVSGSVIAKRQVNDSQKCQELGSGPSPEARAAVTDFIKRTGFVDGQICPGRDGKPDYCAVCEGVFVAVRNQADLYDDCLTPEKLDEAMDVFNDWGDICVTDFGIDAMLLVLMSKVESIDAGAECANKC